MARPRKIRITKNDRADYARLAKNSKAKLRRTLKNYGLDLSDKIEIPDLEEFQTRKQFNKWKETMASFTNRYNLHFQFKKNKNGVVASKAELNEIERNFKLAKKHQTKIRERVEDLPFISGGKPTGDTVGERIRMMKRPDTFLSHANEFDFDAVRRRADLERVMTRAEKRSDPYYYDQAMERLKQNFITALSGSFHSEADDIVEKLQNLRADYFYDMFQQFGELSFDDFDSEGQNVDATEAQLEKIRSYLQMYEEGRLDFDLKGF